MNFLTWLEHTLSLAGFVVWLALAIGVALAGLLRVARRRRR